MNLALVAAGQSTRPELSTRSSRTRTHIRLRLCASSARTARATTASPQQPLVVATPEAVLRKVWAVGEPHRRRLPHARPESSPRTSPQRREAAPVAAPSPEPKTQPQSGLAFYRKYTEAMLRRYLRMSTDAGRVPSLLGRELFRARVSSYRMQSFEDVVIFCLDVERCLTRLEREDQQLIKRITLQEYSQGEAAMLLGLSLRDTVRKYATALDHLTGILLETGLMNELKH